ncbi:MAG: PAS domain S-box protein, partial [Syntrophales bacterium LBB04]|nr:PAS domain S-box protein [Syntrophales bacterium LBB04]
ESTGTAMAIIEDDTTLSLVNTEFEKLAGYAKEEVEGKLSWRDFTNKEDLLFMEERHKARRSSNQDVPRQYEFRFRNKTSQYRDVLLTVDMIPGTNKSVSSLLDISDRKTAEKEKESLILELQRAIAKIRTLSGFLPICANCKKIRDDQGYWQQVEKYIRDHSEAEFSHGLCPDCANLFYSELKDIRSKGM